MGLVHHKARTFLVAVTLVIPSLTAEAQEPPSTAPSSRPTTREAAEVISRELDAVIEEMLADTRFRLSAPSTRPTVTTNESPRERVRREADELLKLAANPSALARNPHAPSLPQAFDDVSNRQFVERAKQVFKDFGFRHADVVEYLLRQDRDRPLSATRLELLARLSTGTLEHLVTILAAPKKR